MGYFCPLPKSNAWKSHGTSHKRSAMRVKGGSGGGAPGAGSLPSPYVKWERVRVVCSSVDHLGRGIVPRFPERSTDRSQIRHTFPTYRRQERCAKIDKDKLGKIRASVDAKSPPRFKHMTVNAKKIQMEEDRLIEIEHQNRKLLTNLSRISERKGVEGHEVGKSKALKRGQAPAGKHKSLNIIKRQEELNRIERENAAILRRIQEQNNKQSEFSVKKMEAEWKVKQEHRKRASQWIG